jgi:hypothetical protein
MVFVGEEGGILAESRIFHVGDKKSGNNVVECRLSCRMNCRTATEMEINICKCYRVDEGYSTWLHIHQLQACA